MTKLNLISSAILLALAGSSFVTIAEDDKTNNAYLERIKILGNGDKLRTQGGATSLLDELELEKFEFDDINRVLATVPGVNIREEDGYGLRPNIGFRGSTSDRSKKINIMEDGVLIGPAPYSAPAAYYFPMVNRMTAVEVFKGPSVIAYGPNTVGGAINLVTRQIPEEFDMGIDLALASDGYKKGHVFHGETAGKWGYVVEGLWTQADGFKQIDNSNADTGFDKSDLMAKVKYDLSDGKGNHFIEFKFSTADETSDETYLGLTDTDFAANPYRRYAASQAGKMDWEHDTLQLTHFIQLDEVDVTTRAYRHKFHRAWRKFSGFTDGKSILDVLQRPDDPNFQDHYALLTGAQDGTLVVGTNDRSYISQGIQTDIGWTSELFGLNHHFDAGVRFHNDYIERDHFTQNYAMQSGQLVNPTDPSFTTVDKEETDAISLYIQDSITIDNLTITAGLRSENLSSRYQDRRVGQEENWQEKDFSIFIPSISAFYKLDDNYGVFAGVHRGFVPSSPKQNDADVDAETSVSYEFGFRAATPAINAELVAFFNDYENLKESCSFANASSKCPLDTDFNGGNVDVYGLEANIKHSVDLGNLEMPWSISYTYSQSEFKESFDSDFPQWGNIEAGDPVPYMPENQLTASLGLTGDNWQVNLLVKHTGEMRETASDGLDENGNVENNSVPLAGSVIKANTVADFSATYNLNDRHSVYTKVDNITDESHVTSRRPDGARPTKPRQALIGYKFRF
ncbi:TonB-dependent receptor [Saccharobesus litoralis]|uniref:TonB-dependent receptor n=1 Tax=Saccharobesus litoralis TaxID=2172099 RepID=A0A2S0VSY3_9ALTE|nr:TonB-dependent receptor [Saccharobesus litoralis]AWB67325.1 TonB-dependent receptor [Saccharobesus litoralis]